MDDQQLVEQLHTISRQLTNRYGRNAMAQTIKAGAERLGELISQEPSPPPPPAPRSRKQS